MRSIALLFIVLSLGAGAQKVNDFGVWGAVSYGTDITDEIDISIEQEVRMAQNATTPGVIFTNIGVDYRLDKAFQIGLNYRFILNDRRPGIYGHRHRVMLDMQLREIYRRWTFGYRARGQSEVRTRNYANEYGFAPTFDMRNTLKTVYRLNRRFELYGSVDLRVLLEDVRIPDFRGVDRMRYRLGSDVLVAKERSVGFFVQYQQEINVPDPDVEIVIGLEYKFGSGLQLFES